MESEGGLGRTTLAVGVMPGVLNLTRISQAGVDVVSCVVWNHHTGHRKKGQKSPWRLAGNPAELPKGPG